MLDGVSTWVVEDQNYSRVWDRVRWISFCTINHRKNDKSLFPEYSATIPVLEFRAKKMPLTLFCRRGEAKKGVVVHF